VRAQRGLSWLMEVARRDGRVITLGERR
jgi:hypothetical protein